MEAYNKQDKTHFRKPTPFISDLFFGYTIPIFKKGYNGDLEESDLLGPVKKDQSNIVGDTIEATWFEELELSRQRNRKPSLLKVVFRAFYWDFLILGALQMICDMVLRMSQPLVLGHLLSYFKPGSGVTKQEAYISSAVLALIVGLTAIMYNHIVMRSFNLGMRVRVALSSLIYRKSLRLSRDILVKTGSGKIMNIISSDLARFDIICYYMNSIWVSPFSVLILLYLVWSEAGLAGSLGVLSVVLLLVPTQAYFCKRSSTYRRQTALRTDVRLGLMNEVITGMKIIKMYAWEKPYSKLIGNARKAEIAELRKMSYMRGMFMALNICSSRTALFVTMTSTVLLGGVLSADKVFVFASYFNTICLNMTTPFVRALAELAEASVSLSRIEDFMIQEEFSKDKQTQGIGPPPIGTAVLINKMVARWKDSSTDSTLEDICMRIKRGKLVAVIGPIGSGKSSLMEAMLGELSVTSGSCVVNGKISYACQEPWVFGSTIRQNIVFGSTFNKTRYEEVLRVCALLPDLEQFPQRDLTLVGERGSSLSGGQKARVNLARAVYNDADVYLLDDPLSAVDTHVGKHLFDECIKSYLKHKTRILVTHQLQYLKDADTIIILNNGKIELEGTFEELMRSDIDYARLLGVDESLVVGEESCEEDLGDIHQFRKVSRLMRELSRMSIMSKLSNKSILMEEEDLGITQRMRRRSSIYPKVERSLLLDYFRCGASRTVLTVTAALFFITQAACSGADYWTSYWTVQEETRHYHHFTNNYSGVEANGSLLQESNFILERDDLYSTEFCLYMYLGIILVLFVASIVRSLAFYEVCMHSSNNIHDAMVSSVLRTELRFFDVNPSGNLGGVK